MTQLIQLFTKLSLRQRLVIGVAAVVLVAGLYAFVRWQTERDFQPLFDNLNPEEAGQIVAKLKEAGIQVRVNDAGTRISVPSAQVAEQRLSLAAQGLPQTGRIGFEIFDQTNFGATDFTEHINYKRAIEGELERSLRTIQAIEQARVHVTFAKNSVFLENKEPAKGSVMVKLRPGATMDPKQSAAIAHLVASAVEGLRPDQVSIIDMRGNLLSRPRKEEGDDGQEPPEALLQYRHRVEADLESKLSSTLDPLLGPGRYRANVSADLDMTSGNESAETFDPESSVMTSTQKQEDVSNGVRSGGVPGTASNLPRSGTRARTTSGGVVRRSESVQFQTSRTVRNTVVPRGVLKRVSVAVLVDHRLRWEGTGKDAKRILEAPSQQTIDSIRELVTGALGLQEDRGDQLVVEALPFDATISEPPPPGVAPAPGSTTDSPLPGWLSFLPRGTPLWVWGAGAGAVLLLLLTAGFLLLRRRKKLRKVTSVPTPPALGAPSAAHAVPRGAGGEFEIPDGFDANSGNLEAFIQEQQERLKLKENAALASLKGVKPRSDSEVLTGHLIDTVSKDPAGAAQILRSWLTEDRR
ncbi:MAG: flagellar M-ring protein FliF [Bryobacterales bacterium]|nr:flagellar M-ring protein FliF [Bryobacterales bacterium]